MNGVRVNIKFNSNSLRSTVQIRLYLLNISIQFRVFLILKHMIGSIITIMIFHDIKVIFKIHLNGIFV